MQAQAFDREKFRELIVYVATKSSNDKRFGAAKLNKLLFFIDFESYTRLGRSITGARYRRIQRGPAPAALLPARRELLRSGEIEIQTVPMGRDKDQERVVARRAPRIDLFTPDEQELIDEVVTRFGDLNGAEISAEAYRLPGVAVAAEEEDIPYDTSFIQTGPWSAEEINLARKKLGDRGLH